MLFRSYPFETLAPHALIADAHYRTVLDEVLPESGIEYVFWRGGEGRTFEGMLESGDASAPKVKPHADDLAALTPSSGTTGAPKGVKKSDRNQRAGPMATLRLTGAQPGDVFLLWESLHHSAGVGVVCAAVLQKLTLAMVEKFSASQFWDQCREFGVTHIHYLGGVLGLLLRQPSRPDDRDHKVRIAWGGG